jgi:hypothetical protein
MRKSPEFKNRTLIPSPNILNSTMINSGLRQNEFKEISIFNLSSKNRPDSGNINFSSKKQTLFERPKPGKLIISPVSDFGNTTINDDTLTGEGQMMRYGNFFSDSPTSPKEGNMIKKGKIQHPNTQPRKHETIQYSSSSVSRSDLKYRLRLDKVNTRNKFKQNMKTLNSCMLNRDTLMRFKQDSPKQIKKVDKDYSENYSEYS